MNPLFEISLHLPTALGTAALMLLFVPALTLLVLRSLGWSRRGGSVSPQPDMAQGLDARSAAGWLAAQEAADEYVGELQLQRPPMERIFYVLNAKDLVLSRGELLGMLDKHFSCFSVEWCEARDDLRLRTEMGQDVTEQLEEFLRELVDMKRVDLPKSAARVQPPGKPDA